MNKLNKNLQANLQLYTTWEVSEILQVDTQYLRAFVKQYKLPYHHASNGRLMLWNRDQIERVKNARAKIKAMNEKIAAMKEEIKRMSVEDIND